MPPSCLRRGRKNGREFRRKKGRQKEEEGAGAEGVNRRGGVGEGNGGGGDGGGREEKKAGGFVAGSYGPQAEVESLLGHRMADARELLEEHLDSADGRAEGGSDSEGAGNEVCCLEG